jgi:hypothetical protein
LIASKHSLNISSILVSAPADKNPLRFSTVLLASLERRFFSSDKERLAIPPI